MKIDWLITELNTLGGAENFVRQMVPRFQQTGQSIRVITFMAGGILLTELRSAGIPVIELGLHNKFDWKALARLGRIWRTEKPDLVHTHLFHAGVVGRIAARAMSVRTVVVHQHGAERARSTFRTLIDRVTSPLVSQYVATCRAVANTIQKREGVPGSKITVIYNGIECIPPPDPILSKRPPLPIMLICVGRLSPEKGHHTLLNALACLNTSHTPTNLNLVGEGELQASLAERSAQPDLNGIVHMLGSRRDVPALLANADIFVLPSDWEGVSMALLEAMAAGLPVVATSVGGTPEVVMDGVTGFLVPPRDPEALAGALSRLLLDPDLRQRMGQAGRQRAFDHFNILHTVHQTQALYERLIQP
jgi:glycosyltransferase involved in cell wall biosynthesis